MTQQPSAANTSIEQGCPNCGEPLGPGTSRFCQACGTQVGASTVAAPAEPDQEERPRPWFWLVMLCWIIIMIAALYFIYARAIVVGSS
jgi:hypothetical protein